MAALLCVTSGYGRQAGPFCPLGFVFFEARVLSMIPASPEPEVGSPAFEYRQISEGLWTAPSPVHHRDDEYDPAGFDVLLRMQERHFWYRGRHRFLLAAVQEQVRGHGAPARPLRAVDLGGGCGGWIR